MHNAEKVEGKTARFMTHTPCKFISTAIWLGIFEFFCCFFSTKVEIL